MPKVATISRIFCSKRPALCAEWGKPRDQWWQQAASKADKGGAGVGFGVSAGRICYRLRRLAVLFAKQTTVFVAVFVVQGAGLTLPPAQAAQAPRQMHIGTVQQIAPDHPVVEQLSAAYHQLGWQMVLETMPLERLKLEVARGKLVDGNLAAAAGLLDDIPQLVQIPVPVYQMPIAVYALPTQKPVRQWSDLQGVRLTYVRGMLSVERRLAQHGLIASLPATTMSQALQYVEKNRVDVAILPCNEAEYVLSQWPVHQLKRQQPLLEQFAMYHYIHQKHQDLVLALTEQLQKIPRKPAQTETLCTQ